MFEDEVFLFFLQCQLITVKYVITYRYIKVDIDTEL